MRNSIKAFAVVVALLIIAIVIFEHSRGSKQESVPAPVPTIEQAMETRKSPPVTNTKADISTPAGPPLQEATANAIEEKAQAMIEAKNIPFDFYGRVIDQDSNSLPGVKFSLAVRHWNTNSLGSIHIERETDADGRFDIHDRTGDAFDIESVGKQGYELEPGQRGFGAIGGNFDDPVIFKMWSTNIHEQLITDRKSFKIEPDGRPYVIDLIKGTIAESGDGDLKVWVKRPKQITYGKRYDWACEIDVIHGGLQEALDPSMYLAPTEGYTPSFTFDQKVGSGWGDSTGEKRFYIKLKNGEVCGSITIEMCAYYNDHTPGMIRIKYVLNPSGSRILR